MRRAAYALLASALLSFLPLRADVVVYGSGDGADVAPRLHGPVLILAGGGGDVDDGMQAAIDRIRGCADCDAEIDVAVIRASGADGYNPWFMERDGVDSVISMVITDRDSAARPDLVRAVAEAELVFFAGGDQCNYVRWIKGTPMADAVKSVYDRGGAVGGSSAGLAIQGELAYDACPDQSAQSAVVLLDPFHVDVSVSRDFFAWAPLRGVITDTHFQQRDRLGRLVVFMARSEDVRPLTGLGISEATIVLVDREGKAEVFGKGPAHLVVAGGRAAVLAKGTPLTFRGLRIARFESGERFDLHDPPAARFKPLDAVGGTLSANPY
ncbi:MAG TPA: cyanophycinase [Thermoanaerobaculia bacterium]